MDDLAEEIAEEFEALTSVDSTSNLHHVFAEHGWIVEWASKGVGRAQPGETNPASKLTSTQVLAIRALEGKIGPTAVGRLYGVSKPTIIGIWRGKTWMSLEREKQTMREGEAVREKLEEMRAGLTQKFKITALGPEGPYEVKGYIQTGCYADGRVGEIFIRMGKSGEAAALLDQWAIAFSVGLQYGCPLEVMCEKFLRSRFEPSGRTACKEIPMCSSLVDYVCHWLMIRYGKSETPMLEAAVSDEPATNGNGGPV